MENELENEELHDIIAHNHVIQWISHARDLSFYVTVGIPYYIRRIRNFLCRATGLRYPGFRSRRHYCLCVNSHAPFVPRKARILGGSIVSASC